jgi:Arc/MetJ family transcription regulator
LFPSVQSLLFASFCGLASYVDAASPPCDLGYRNEALITSAPALDHTPKRWLYVYMRTNIDLDDELVARGLRLSGLKTKKELVNLALKEFVRRKDQKKILELRGKIKWTGDLESMRLNRF